MTGASGMRWTAVPRLDLDKDYLATCPADERHHVFNAAKVFNALAARYQADRQGPEARELMWQLEALVWLLGPFCTGAGA